ncbi:MAG: hypothetical protein EA380_00230 [Phycisphaeraceae bacterium]|nr:MAG: hypothetical protein EA380_00230 [Phycisphaeraceae bacterium]
MCCGVGDCVVRCPVLRETECVIFTGHYEHAIDEKGRLAIPAEFRSRWDTARDGAAWQAIPWVGGIIRLYTERGFLERANLGELTLMPDEDEAEIQATLFGLSKRIEPDSAGRIRVPDDMLAMVGLGRNVVLVGLGDRLEIRDRDAWLESKGERLAKLPELMRRMQAKKKGV